MNKFYNIHMIEIIEELGLTNNMNNEELEIFNKLKKEYHNNRISENELKILENAEKEKTIEEYNKLIDEYIKNKPLEKRNQFCV